MNFFPKIKKKILAHREYFGIFKNSQGFLYYIEYLKFKLLQEGLTKGHLSGNSGNVKINVVFFGLLGVTLCFASAVVALSNHLKNF